MQSLSYQGHLAQQLKGILGAEGFVQFCQAMGGTRVYVPYVMRDGNEIVRAVGQELADKLARAMAPATIRVPLARRDRALYFRAAGLSDAKIARQLGITESGVCKLFGRETDLPERPGKATSPAQLDLF